MDCALDVSSGKDFICQLAVQDYWVSKREMRALKHLGVFYNTGHVVLEYKLVVV